MTRAMLSVFALIIALAFAWPGGANPASADDKGPRKDDKCQVVKRECRQQCRSAEAEKCVKACAKDDRKCKTECRKDEHKCLRDCREKHPECAAESERDKGKDDKGKGDKGKSDKGKSGKAQECRQAFQACHKDCGDDKECRQECVTKRKTCMEK